MRGGWSRPRGNPGSLFTGLTVAAIALAGCGNQSQPAGEAQQAQSLAFAVTGTAWPGTIMTEWTQHNAPSAGVRFAIDSDALDVASALWPAERAAGLLLPMSPGRHVLTAQAQKSETAWTAAADGAVDVDQTRANAGSGLGFTCWLRTSGKIYCLGDNSSGQLGVGDTKSRGGAPADMGAGLAAVDLGAATQARAVAVGLQHACAIDQGGAVACWGDNHRGQLGIDKVDAVGATADGLGAALQRVALPSPVQSLAAGGNLTAALLNGGKVAVWGGSLARGQTATLALPAAAVAVTAGDAHVCALLADGRVACGGNNAFAQLGQGNKDPQELPKAVVVDLGSGRTARLVRAGGAQSCAVLDNLALKCWGRVAGPTEEARVGDALPAVPLGAGRYAIEVAIGGGHFCALRDDQKVLCFGLNDQGQLGRGVADQAVYPVGQGDALDALMQPVDLGSSRPRARGVTAGAYHSCALAPEDIWVCWGGNGAGQLGTGDLLSRGRSADGLGDALMPVMLPN